MLLLSRLMNTGLTKTARAVATSGRRNFSGLHPKNPNAVYTGVEKHVRKVLPETYQIAAFLFLAEWGFVVFLLTRPSKKKDEVEAPQPVKAVRGKKSEIPSILDDNFDSWSKVPGNFDLWAKSIENYTGEGLK